MTRFLVSLSFIVLLPTVANAQTFDGDPQRVDSTTVPDLTNHTKLGIIPVLLITRLKAGRTDSVLNEQMQGRVVRQSPAPKTRVPRGTAINLWFGYARPRAVPDLRGSTLTGAVAKLAEVDLRLGQVDTALSADGTGLITRQRPAAHASVNPGTQVRVSVTIPPLIAVPSLIDSTVTGARALLSSLDLVLVRADTIRTAGARNVITTQDPAPLTLVARGAPVRVTVTLAPPLVRVPNLIGTTVAQARDSLSRVGLRLAGTDSARAVGGVGRIARQQPLPGSAADVGSGVSITVTMPQDTGRTPPARVMVPNVVGVSLQQAVATLIAAGLNPGAVDSVRQAQGTGRVIAQAPRAGTQVDPATNVQLQLAVPIPSVPLPMTLPNLVGMPKVRAQRLLDSLGVRYTTVEVRRRAAVDTVVSQEPAAGTVITATMHATLTVGRSWLPLVLIVLVALVAVVALVLRTQRWREWPPAKANLHIVPHPDTGKQTIDGNGELIREEVLWTSHTDTGTQNVKDGFALREDEH
jgi:beta-lactam-binding protein with PASTA domain